MRTQALKYEIVIVKLFVWTLFLFASAALADPVQEGIELGVQNNQREQATQRRINKLSDETQTMLDEYHAKSRELKSLTIYNDQLQRLINSQSGETRLLQQQINDITLTQQEIVPLMLRMIEHLDALIDKDAPFLVGERRRRVRLLREIMDRADVAVAEKYRRVLEAYQIELDYGRTLEAYRGELNAGEKPRTVDFLRIGRLGLYYRTLDGHEAGFWNDTEKGWLPLNAGQRLALRQAFRIAKQQTAPELIELPVATAQAEQ